MMNKIGFVLTIAMVLFILPGMVQAITCTGTEDSKTIALGETQSIDVACSGIGSGESVSVVGTYSSSCMSAQDSVSFSLTAGSPSNSVTFEATSMACQGNADDRKITWTFTHPTESITSEYTQVTITSPQSIAAGFVSTPYAATAGTEVTVILEVSTSAVVDITGIAADMTSSISDITGFSGSTIYSSGSQKTIQNSWTFSAPSTAGTYPISSFVTSTNADADSASTTLTVTAAGVITPGGDTGGGTTGGGAGVTSGIKQTINIGELVAGTPGIAQFTLTNLALRLVTITSTSDSVGVSVKAEQEASLPSGAGTSPQGTVYGFLTITALNVDNDDIETATIQFRVNKTWLGNNGIDPADIILQRFHDGVWQELNTSVKSSGTDYVTYSASTPGFSVFAITSKPVPVVAGDDASLCNNNGICEDGEDITNCAADCQIDGDASPPTTGDVISTDTPESLPITVYIVVLVIIIIIILAFVIMKRNKNI